MRDHGGAGPLSEIADARKVVGMRVGVEDMRQSRIAGGQRLLELVHLIQAWIDGQGGTAGLAHPRSARQPSRPAQKVSRVRAALERVSVVCGGGRPPRSRHVASSMAFHS
jgi:hypothetical protein